MKKLMIAFAAIAMAVCAQAATVSWAITNVKNDNGLLTKGSEYVFFYTSAAEAQSAATAFAALAGTGADAVQSAMNSASWSGTKKATAAGAFSVGSSTAMGGVTLSNSDLGLSGETRYYALAVIFDTETITDESNYIVATGTATTAGVVTKADAASQNAAFTIGSQASNTSWNAVAAVPEPTSGLLLLLGMAGLALKRKQA